jgi:kinesin family protein 1
MPSVLNRANEYSTSLLKSGYLFTPDETNKVWTKRYFELRRPYMHVHSVPDGEEIMAINLAQCRIDHQPQVAKLLRRPHIFAVYAPLNTYLFAARGEREMIEWIMKVDQFHFFSNDDRRSDTPDECE